MGFEPTNNGFAIRRLRPLGYAAETFSTPVRLVYLSEQKDQRPVQIQYYRFVHRTALAGQKHRPPMLLTKASGLFLDGEELGFETTLIGTADFGQFDLNTQHKLGHMRLIRT